MIIALLIVLGLCFGSFVNALVWRLRQQSLPKKRRAAKDAELSIVTGRSMCPHCKHTLAWYDLLPVVSWLGLQGKCRYCKSPVSVQYPLVELLTAVAFVVSYVAWPISLDSGLAQIQFVFWLVSLIFMAALLVYDLKWMLLPNRLTGPFSIVTAVYALIGLSLHDGSTQGALISLFGAVTVTAGLFYLLFRMSDGRWIGGGDVKLAVGLGLLVGSIELGFLLLLTASVLGLVIMLPSVIKGKSGLSAKLPFGPFLILGTIVTVLVGNELVDWYINTVLFI